MGSFTNPFWIRNPLMKPLETLVFATRNRHKVAEFQAVAGMDIRFLSLEDINCLEELPETTGTVPGNALQKARYVFEHYGKACFAEDTGLFVDALDGAPGVDTAYYAGPQRNALDNNTKLLDALGSTQNRSARFITFIALVTESGEQLFEGVMEGSIATAMTGSEGFGYDPVFIPQGHLSSMATLGMDVKNNISHRAKATRNFLQSLQGIQQ